MFVRFLSEYTESTLFGVAGTMSTNQGKWPIVLAVGLLCLMTLLSIFSWSGQNPVQNRLSSVEPEPRPSSILVEELKSHFAKPISPRLPAEKPKPKLNRYESEFGDPNQKADPGSDSQFNPTKNTVGDTLATQDGNRPPSNLLVSNTKPIAGEISNSQSNQRSIEVTPRDQGNWPLITNSGADLSQNQRLQDVFGDKTRFDFESIPNRPLKKTPSLSEGESSLLVNPSNDIDLSQNEIESQRLAQVDPSSENANIRSPNSELPPEKADSDSTREENTSEKPKSDPLDFLPENSVFPQLKEGRLPRISSLRPSVKSSSSKVAQDDAIIDLIGNRSDSQKPTQAHGTFRVANQEKSSERESPIEHRINKSSEPHGARLGSPRNHGSQSSQPVVVSPASTTKRQPLVEAKENNVTGPPVWPSVNPFLAEINELGRSPELQTWSRDTATIVTSLSKTHDLAQPEVGKELKALFQQISKLDALGSQALELESNRQNQLILSSAIQRMRYRLQRRVEIWSAVYRLAASGESNQEANITTDSRNPFPFRFDNVPQSWLDYLHVAELQKVFNDPRSTERQKTFVSRRFLMRATANHLNEEQFRFVEKIISAKLARFVRNHATRKTDLVQFLAHLEQFEIAGGGIAHYYLNDHYQNLYWSNDPAANYLAELIDVHYRNANIRVSVSEKLINRLLPELPFRDQDSEIRGFGSNIFGPSVISKNVSVDLKPNQELWQVQLTAKGQISRARSHREPLIASLNEASYSAAKDIFVGPRKTTQGETNVEAGGPQLAEMKIKNATRERFDREVQSGLQQLANAVHKRWFYPLATMDLEPKSVNMHTTEERMILRYRLGGQDQMAAHTARPMAIRNSVLSAQVHESAVNNFIAKTMIGGRRFTMQEFVKYLNRVLGFDVISPDDPELDNDVEFVLAKLDPIRMDFDDNHLSVTVRLRNLRIGSSVWKNVAVTCPFDLVAQGLNVRLQKREPGIQLKGRQLRLRDQIAIRSIFHKLIERDFSFELNDLPMVSQLKLKGLWVSQLVFAKGWVGCSINDESTLPNRSTVPKDQETHHLSRQPHQPNPIR